MCAFEGPNVRRVSPRRFVRGADAPVEQLPWGPHRWFSRPELTDTHQLLVVEVTMPPGAAHRFHRHPGREEVLYVIDGSAEQWIDREKLILGAGDGAFVPQDVVHGIYNDGERAVRFLAILSPAEADGPLLVECQHDEPWRRLRAP